MKLSTRSHRLIDKAGVQWGRIPREDRNDGFFCIDIINRGDQPGVSTDASGSFFIWYYIDTKRKSFAMTFREGPSVIEVSTLAALFVCNYDVVTHSIKRSNGKF